MDYFTTGEVSSFDWPKSRALQAWFSTASDIAQCTTKETMGTRNLRMKKMMQLVREQVDNITSELLPEMETRILKTVKVFYSFIHAQMHEAKFTSILI